MSIEFIVRDWTGLDISDGPVPDGDPVLDYPLAWEICKMTRKEQHHQQCSYRVAGMLCDCVGMDAARATLKVMARRVLPQHRDERE